MTEVINYTCASKMASVFAANTKRITGHLTEVEKLTSELGDVFGNRGYGFNIQLEFAGRHRENIETIIKLMKLSAWAQIVEHTGIRKVMSASRQNELDKVLRSSNANDADKLPDITEETIFSVLEGFMQSASEFLNEAIDEIYNWVKPGRHSKFATNQKSIESARLESKVVLTLALDGKAWQSDGWNVGYHTRPKLMALDNIFHILDGAGPLSGHRGPLLDTIALSETGSTKYFRFRGFKNRNLHLEFIRYDLLQKFNQICGRNRLGSRPNKQSSNNGLFELMKQN